MKYVVVKWGNTIGCLLSYSFPKTTCLLRLSREHGLYQYVLNEHDERGDGDGYFRYYSAASCAHAAHRATAAACCLVQRKVYLLKLRK